MLARLTDAVARAATLASARLCERAGPEATAQMMRAALAAMPQPIRDDALLVLERAFVDIYQDPVGCSSVTAALSSDAVRECRERLTRVVFAGGLDDDERERLRRLRETDPSAGPALALSFGPAAPAQIEMRREEEEEGKGEG